MNILYLAPTEPHATFSAGEIIPQLLLLVVLIALNAFFVVIEFAVVVSRRSRVDQMAVEGGYGARILRRWLSDAKGRERLVAAAQLGVSVLESEIVGLVPEAALAGIDPADLRLPNFSSGQILEHRLAATANRTSSF